MDSSETSGAKRRRTKVSKACNNCRRRKIKCTGGQPCLNCQTYQCTCTYALPSPPTGIKSDAASDTSLESAAVLPAPLKTSEELPATENGMYEDDSEFQQELAQQKACLQALQAAYGASPSQKLYDILQETRTKILNMEKEWMPAVRNDKLQQDVPATSISTETQLMFSKYSEQVYLTKYSILEPPDKRSSRTSVLNQQPAVDDVFGLYSPHLSLSIRGMGILFKSFFDQSSKLAPEVKKTLYLMLRFYDFCFDHLDSAVLQWSMPVETFLDMRSIPLTNKNEAIRDILSEIPLELTAMTKALYPKYGKPRDLENKVSMFHWVIRVIEVCHKQFQRRMISTTAVDTIAGEVSRFLHVEDMLSVVAFEYLNLTSYTMCGDLDYLESLLILIKQQYWISDWHVFTHLLTMALSYAQNLGINRWEFYVGMNEEIAERRRYLWWECYAWDKFYAVQTGKQPFLDENLCNCLPIKAIRQQGYLDHQEFLHNMTSLHEPITEDRKELMQYTFITVSLLIGSFYKDILYNRRFTDFRNYAKPSSFQEAILFEIIEGVDHFIFKMDALKSQAKGIYDLSERLKNMSSVPLEEKECVLEASLIIICIEYYFCLCMSSVDHLFARFKVREFPKTINSAMGYYKKRAYESWKKIMQLMEQRLVLMLWQSIGPIGIVLLTFIADVSTHFQKVSLADFLLALRVSRNLTELTMLDNGVSSPSTRTYRNFTKCRTFCQILVRILTQLYMRTEGIEQEELIRRVNEIDGSLVETVKRALDVTSGLFKECFVTGEASSFHLALRRSFEEQKMLDRKAEGLLPVDVYKTNKSAHDQNNLNDFKPPTLDGIHPLESSPKAEAFFLGSLDEFMSRQEDDVYNKLWSDIKTSFPDLLQE
ncbi:LAMI_0D06216g1_1 [Lachancea mirantina]|uniref:LAMI_0D06216g1_1 n=1 Tax=Lachancea mirantina TaxID=1230905 RepID=A0A1G4JBJ1_9SACH|nr:LAMI_0D06216g1_1 [Lachancea mirantina]